MKYPDRYLIVIPTYNEADNIEQLINEILALSHNLNILIIDDNSKDGTSRIVEKLAKKDKRISIIQRPSKLGYASAVLEGFKFCLANNFDAVIQMDADFSHKPEYLKEFVKHSKENQVVIGSRYVKGGGVLNWPLKRRALSYFANIYVRLLTGIGIRDCTSGFRCLHREAVESINIKEIKSEGYSFLIECSYTFWQQGYSIKEVPIIFVEREKGISKISKKIIVEAFFVVLRLALNRLRK